MPPANTTLARHVGTQMRSWPAETTAEWERLSDFWAGHVVARNPNTDPLECAKWAKFYVATAMQHEIECGGSVELDELREIAATYAGLQREVLMADRAERARRRAA